MNQSHDAYRIAEQEMLPGEELLWAEKPLPGRVALQSLPSALLAIPFLLVALVIFRQFLGFGMGHLMPGGMMGGGSIFSIVIGVFVLVGLWMVLSPLWSYRQGGNTVYAITDRRALIITGGRVQSYGASDIEVIERRAREDGVGDVIFRYDVIPYSSRNSVTGFNDTRTRRKPVGFFGVQDAYRVEALLLDVFRPDDEWLPAAPAKHKRKRELPVPERD